MLTEVLTQVALVVAIMLLVSIPLFIGRERLTRLRTDWQSRLRTSAPAMLILSVVLLFNRVMRQDDPDIGVHMTETIRGLEGEFILIFQQIGSTELTMYFSFIYVYGYTFLLIFPAVAYFALSDTRMFRRLLTSYTLNYAIGLTLYALVIAYGPRNFMPEVETVLYNASPEYQHLTREVNRNTNVFPSLHTSLAATVGLFAYHTRSSYPKWYLVATVLAVSVIISTMYLGLHWATDVVAGLALAAFCVAASDRIVGRWSLSAIYTDLRSLRERRADRSDGADGDP
ncbi:phosphatase PAP2 family protein [Natronorubrum sp. JWXQ-INN-674]|uniref:Phosphatase PAP2 family protein n=1 Tax=Natronorubrum halalkaliphilum TaxID=2691917 RepID=A0A6B0VQV4_9EURY|nr:phosphatase PAP2 family protein [Natronorubrum halalkaliphilum]MXV64020.1 phosphatase PAP2 family protein [Natronorubrum halalkaliphilum]